MENAVDQQVVISSQQSKGLRLNSPTVRSVLSLLTFSSFVGVGITGVLMFFHLRVPGIKTLHDWSGVFFFVVAVLHLLVNWKAFVSYFRTKAKEAVGHSVRAYAIVASVLIASAALLLLGANRPEGHGPPREGQTQDRPAR